MDIPSFYDKKTLTPPQLQPMAEGTESWDFLSRRWPVGPWRCGDGRAACGDPRGFQWELLKWDILILHAYNDSTVYYM